MKSISEIKYEARLSLANRWSKPTLIFLFVLVLSLTLSLVIGTANNIKSMIINALSMIFIIQPFTMGASIFILKFVRREEVSLGIIFDGYKYILKLFIISVFMFALSFAFSHLFSYIMNGENSLNALEALIFSLSGIILFLIDCYLSQVYFLLYDRNDLSSFKIIGLSFKLMKGNITRYILLQFSFCAWVLGAIITGGILIIWLKPYLETANSIFYEDLIKNVRKE